MSHMDKDNLAAILAAHGQFLDGDPAGQCADLSGANLSGANLSNADLRNANLRNADLSGTCLDPAASVTQPDDLAEWERLADDRVIGYRSRGQPMMGGPKYQDGQEYVAPWFSVAETECHPGLYVCCSPDDVDDVDGVVIRVAFAVSDIHAAGRKCRVRRFTVIGATGKEGAK